MKVNQIHFRVSDSTKEHLTKICEEQGITMTDFFLRMIDEPLSKENRKLIFSFLTTEDAQYSKVGNNINQIARIVNSEKSISESLLSDFNFLLRELLQEKQRKIQIINQIFKIISK